MRSGGSWTSRCRAKIGHELAIRAAPGWLYLCLEMALGCDMLHAISSARICAHAKLSYLEGPRAASP